MSPQRRAPGIGDVIVALALDQLDNMHEEHPAIVPRFDRSLLPPRLEGEPEISHATRCLDVIEKWSLRQVAAIERMKVAARLTLAVPSPVGDS